MKTSYINAKEKRNGEKNEKKNCKKKVEYKNNVWLV